MTDEPVDAALDSLRPILAPRSIAVIGASRDRGTIGGEIFHGLLDAGFAGAVYPVNPQAEVVQSVRAYASIGDVPGPVELGVIVVPAAAVLEVARECAVAGVRALVVISAGFAEIGSSGAARQGELLDVCRQAGMRLVGPNCMGVLNASPDIRMNATFSPTFPPHGRVGFLSQSGALGLAVIDRAAELGLGLSTFVSVGNKADVSGNDLISYWEQDDDTDLILLYLESFGNPRKFSRIARRVSRRKPILAVKSGRSTSGVRATGSHTGALLAASDAAVDALFHQAGVIRTETLAELFDAASLLANQPPPAGPRVGIVTNAGGPGILCADACEAKGLSVNELSDRTKAALADPLPTEASVTNPIDMIASASAEDYGRTIRTLAESGEVDAIVVIFIPPLVTRADDVAAAIRDAAIELQGSVSLLTVFMQSHGIPDELRSDRVRIPSYTFPEDAARALAQAVRYGARLREPEGIVPRFPDLQIAEASKIVRLALDRGPGWLPPDEVDGLLDCFGVPTVETRSVATEEEAAEAAAGLGWPVVLKVVAPELLHKTEAGAVRLGLNDPSAVRTAAEEMRAAVVASGHDVGGFLVQQMVEPGVEMLIGVVHDPVFGPVVACGAGGTAVELLKDVRVRIAPLTDRDASEMVRSLATFPRLEGYRGAPPGDVGALEELLLRVGAMADQTPEIAEMDCNPVIVGSRGAIVVDARIRVAPSPA